MWYINGRNQNESEEVLKENIWYILVTFPRKGTSNPIPSPDPNPNPNNP